MAEDDDLGAIFGNPKEEVSEPEDMETTPGAPPVKILPVAPADKGAAAFDTPEPKAVAGRKGGLRGKSVSPKRKLQFGTDSDEEEGKVQAVNPPQRTKRVAKRRRGQSLPAPALVVTAPPDDDDEEEEAGAVPRRSPRKPPTTRRFDPAKAGAARKKRRASPKEEDDEEEEAANKNRQKKRKAANKTKQTKKRKNGKAKKESEDEDDDEEGDAVGDEDERDEDFGNRKPAPKKKRKATTSDKDVKKSPSKKVPLANENQINEKVEQEMEVLSEYFADVDDTPLEEEEPPGTKWVSMPMLKSPQRIERLAKYPTIAKDYDDYKKALTEAQVEPAPITEFVKDLEDKRLEAVIQP